MANIHNYSAYIKPVNSFDGALTASTQNGSGVDTFGYRRAALVFNTTTGAATTANFQLQDSPDNATWTNVSGGTLGSAVAASTSDYTQVVDIDLAKRQRYLRVQVIGTGTAGSAVANVHLYEAFNAAPTQVNTPITL